MHSVRIPSTKTNIAFMLKDSALNLKGGKFMLRSDEQGDITFMFESTDALNWFVKELFPLAEA